MDEPGARLSRRRFLSLTGAGLVATLPVPAMASGCSSSGASATGTLKVGVVAPFSGPDSATGAIVTNSLRAAVHQINATGGVSGRELALILHDSGAQVQGGASAWASLRSESELVAILWCGSIGLDSLLPQIRASGVPLISVFYDLYSGGLLYPPGATSGGSVFQMSLPEAYGQAALAAYARGDRGYTSAGLLYDSAYDTGGSPAATFSRTFGKAGLSLTTPQTFSTGAKDLGPQLVALRAAAPEAVYFHGLPGDLATAAEGLATLAASFVDDPTTKARPWHPQLFVSTRAMSGAAWAATAGLAAKVGTVAPAHLGGLPYLPGFAVGHWMTKYSGTTPVGDEDLPADALYAVIQAVKSAGSSDHRSVVRALEGLHAVSFASLPFGFSASDHVGLASSDTALLTIEYLSGPAPTNPAYQLGKEWQTGQLYGSAAVAPSQLVRPTLAANRAAHSQVVAGILSQGWGTQCTKLSNGTLSSECKIH